MPPKKSPDGSHTTVPEKHKGLIDSDRVKPHVTKKDKNRSDAATQASEIIPGHSQVSKATVSNPAFMRNGIKLPEKSAFVYKRDEFPARDQSIYTLTTAQIETVSGLCYYILSPKHSPIIYPVIDHHTKIINATLVTFLDGFEPMSALLEKDTFQTEMTKESLLGMGVIEILCCSYLFGENDLHDRNWGKKNDSLFRIDFDQSLWATISNVLFVNPQYAKDQNGRRPEESMPLTLHDIQNFPDIKDHCPEHWPTREITEGDSLEIKNINYLAKLLKSLKTDKTCIMKKYQLFYSYAVLFQTHEFITALLNVCIHPESDIFNGLVESIEGRAKQIFDFLKTDKEFKKYYENIAIWHVILNESLKEISSKIPHIVSEQLRKIIRDKFAELNQQFIETDEKTAAERVKQAESKGSSASPTMSRERSRHSVTNDNKRKQITELQEKCEKLLEKKPKESEQAVCEKTTQIEQKKIDRESKTLLIWKTWVFIELISHACGEFDEETLATQLIAIIINLKKLSKYGAPTLFLPEEVNRLFTEKTYHSLFETTAQRKKLTAQLQDV